MRSNNLFWIGGKHAVLAAINNNKRTVHKIYASENFLKNHPELNSKATIQNIKKIDNLFQESQVSHQGIAAQVSELQFGNIKNIEDNNSLKKIIILDNITDQRNIGSIIRTALAFNIDALIIDKRIFNQKNQLMIKASVGAIEHLNIFTTSNIKNEIKLLKKNNFWIYGMDLSAKNDIVKTKFQDRTCLIFGSESKGLKKIIKDSCDELIKIKINSKIDSLNVSNSVAATLSIINLND